MPQISVLMPVYDVPPHYLRQAIDSILAQTFADFEFLIVDDSADPFRRTVEELARQDPRIRVLRGPGQGIAAALNAGLAAASGIWIARMDGDDISLPTRFERQLAYLGDHPECVAVGSFVLSIDEDGNPMFVTRRPLSHDEIDGMHMHAQGGGIIHPTAMIRRAVMQAIQGYSEDFGAGEDLDLFLRLAERGRLANQPDILLRYRDHFASSTYAREAEAHALGVRAINAARRRRGLPEFHDMAPQPLRDKSRVARIWICTSILENNYTAARRQAWRYFRSEPFSWRAAACLALSLMGRAGAQLLKWKNRAGGPAAADRPSL